MMHHNSKPSKWVYPGVLTTVVFLIFAASGLAADKVNKNTFGVAIKGYDAVSYHTEGRPMKGDSRYTYEWNDATWHFSSTKNRDLFAGDPERFAPQYGGY